MRLLSFGAGALICAASTLFASASASFTQSGTVWVGDRSEPNVAVWLDAPDAAAAPPPKRVVLDQRNLSFSPHVLVVRVGTRVELPNNDRVFHNIFSFRDGRRFDLGLYPVGTVKYVTFDRPGLSRLFCNIHPNMAAYVLAVNTPYFAVSDLSGRFEIPSVLPGAYTYHAWRPGGSECSGTAVLQAGQSLGIHAQ